MQLHIGSKHLNAEVSVALDVEGAEHLVIVAKASWRIPEPGQRPRPLPPPPIVFSDEYLGEPGQSAMRYGDDVARFKPRCDVILDAHAHSPTGDPVTSLIAGIEIDDWRKHVRVHGPRQWCKRRSGWELTLAQRFASMPLHHGLALGGTREYKDEGRVLTEAHLHNPAGQGWAGQRTLDQLDGQAAPQLEHPNQPIQQPDAALLPHGLSAVGRHWLPRRGFAGTYDETWQRDVFPLLPPDFDEQFNQCAPQDQQLPYPCGGETVRLINLMPGRPKVTFRLPSLQLPLRVLRSDYTRETPEPVVDTLFFEPEEARFSVVWRTSLPIRRRLQEFSAVAIGPVDRAWWEAKSLGLDEAGCPGCRSDMPQPARASRGEP